MARSLSLIVLGTALAWAAGLGCAASADGDSTADEDEVRSKAGRIEIFDDGARFGVALVASDGERVLTMNERFADRAAAEAGSVPLLAHGTTGYAYFARQEMNGDWLVDLMNNGHAVATTHAYRAQPDAIRGAGLARSLLRRAAFPQAAKALLGQLRFHVTLEKDKQHHFRMHDQSGALLLSSEPYRTLSSALEGTDSVRLYGTDERAYQFLPRPNGNIQLSIMAYNGETVAWGELYGSKHDAQRAAEQIKALLERGVPTVE